MNYLLFPFNFFSFFFLDEIIVSTLSLWFLTYRFDFFLCSISFLYLFDLFFFQRLYLICCFFIFYFVFNIFCLVFSCSFIGFFGRERGTLLHIFPVQCRKSSFCRYSLPFTNLFLPLTIKSESQLRRFIVWNRLGVLYCSIFLTFFTYLPFQLSCF